MAATIGRFPLVSRDEILLAYRPGAEASEGTFRTLRAHQVVSHGIGIRLRRRNRLAGQVRVYSALNLDAAVLARHKEIDEAQKIAAKAERQEERWEPKLEKLLVSIDVENLQSLHDARNRLAHEFIPLSRDVERVRRQFKVLDRWLQESLGVVTELTDTWASLRLFTPTREVVEVQRFLADAVALRLGDLCVLRLERLKRASLVGIVPAVAEPEDLAGEGSVAGSDEVSDYLERLREPVTLHSETVDALRARRAQGDTIRVPPRRIRLAG